MIIVWFVSTFTVTAVFLVRWNDAVQLTLSREVYLILNATASKKVPFFGLIVKKIFGNSKVKLRWEKLPFMKTGYHQIENE